MGIIGIILLVVFVIICLLLIGLVLLQNDEGGMGGLFGGAGGAAFGSRSATVLTKATYVLVTLFFVSSLGLALLNKAPSEQQLNPGVQQNEAAPSQWWESNEEPANTESAELEAN